MESSESSSNYNWQRYWVGLGEVIHPSPEGFLQSPDEKWGKYINSGLKTAKELESIKCLIL